MSEKLVIREVVLVEGKYDKITLSGIIDATIMTTGGFSVFNNAERRALFRRLGEERGVIILTDSDGGGGQIRSYLAGVIPKDRVKHLYIPLVSGKEKRKRVASRAGTLGVEGMKPEVLRHLFEPLAVDAPRREGREITATDLYERGLLGGEGSAAKRANFCKKIGFPPMGAKPLAAALNCLYTYDDFRTLCEESE